MNATFAPISDSHPFNQADSHKAAVLVSQWSVLDSTVTLTNRSAQYAALRQPSGQPSSLPTTQPTTQPSLCRPHSSQVRNLSRQPSSLPTGKSTRQPSVQPNTPPSGQPTGRPSGAPTSQPSILLQLTIAVLHPAVMFPGTEKQLAFSVPAVSLVKSTVSVSLTYVQSGPNDRDEMDGLKLFPSTVQIMITTGSIQLQGVQPALVVGSNVTLFAPTIRSKCMLSITRASCAECGSSGGGVSSHPSCRFLRALSDRCLQHPHAESHLL